MNPTPSAPAPHRARGFTLVELLAVLVVAGILAFAAMGRLNDVGEVNAQGYADEVASSLRFAQKAAIAQRRSIYVNVVPSGARVYACLDSATPCAQPLLQPAGGNLDLSGPVSVTLSTNTTQFSFNGMGSPSSTSAVQIVATAASGHQFTVIVQPDTGFVQRI